MGIEIKDFWTRISDLLKQHGLSQIKLCELADIPIQTFRGWILKDRYPNIIEIIKISQILNVSVEYLVTGKDKNELPDDIRKIESMLLQFNEDQRSPIIAMLEGQINFWKKQLGL